MRSRVIFVGLDACDPAVARHLAASGHLPNLHRLLGRSARCKVQNPYGLFVGALWMSFATAVRPDRHQFHCWDEIEIASYQHRLSDPPRHLQPTFWHALSDAGRRVAVIDVPHRRATRAVNGLEIVEWGTHDRHFGFHTWPAGAAADIESAFGLHPIFGVDARAVRDFAPDDYAFRDGAWRNLSEDRSLLQGIAAGVRQKGGLAATLLAQENWDLFVAVFGESHAIGHQQWHHHDRSHPRFDAAAAAALGGDPLTTIYRELDAGLGAILEQADEDATVLVLFSHGMGPHYDGSNLLDTVLQRIDLFEGNGSFEFSVKGVLKGAARSMPPWLQRHATAFAMPYLRNRIGRAPPQACPDYIEPSERARQRFFLEPNNYVMGGIRLNLIGREPSGRVAPDEVDVVCRRLADDLLALVNVETGDRVVRGVERADRWYRRSSADKFPDLFVEWENSAPIETVWSPKIGLLHSPTTHWRSGDHRPDGLLLACGPGIPASRSFPEIDVEDIGPSIAARLGVELSDIDGSAAPWLSRPH